MGGVQGGEVHVTDLDTQDVGRVQLLSKGAVVSDGNNCAAEILRNGFK